MAKQKFKRNILIVTEGTSTEPKYFNFIAENISYPKKIWDKVEVSDNKTIPNDIPITSKNKLKKRKKRKIKNPNKHKEEERNVLKELCEKLYGIKHGIAEYEKNKAVPLRYVAQTQLIEKKTHLYEELWAVFDKNGHSHHKEAYERAVQETNGKIVNIGFSSRSFELWILLHFERTDKVFETTECKVKKKTIGCNSSIGCKGAGKKPCLIGYIRVNTPLKNYAKSNKQENLKAMMDILLNKKKLQSAFENAAWLRFIQKNKSNKKIYEINPYTDVDILVKKLLNYQKKIIWADFNKKIKFNEYEFILSIENKIIEITVVNKLAINLLQFYLKKKQIHKITKLTPKISKNILTFEIIQFENYDFCIEKNNQILMFEL